LESKLQSGNKEISERRSSTLEKNKKIKKILLESTQKKDILRENLYNSGFILTSVYLGFNKNKDVYLFIRFGKLIMLKKLAT
jgi:hypothetical protein